MVKTISISADISEDNQPPDFCGFAGVDVELTAEEKETRREWDNRHKEPEPKPGLIPGTIIF